jgi:4a-hydroxytetrahydrobiopterin dehydratase
MDNGGCPLSIIRCPFNTEFVMLKALSSKEIKKRLTSLSGWRSTGKEISRVFDFKNYYETMAFVNAVAFLAHRADHHPDLEVGYNKCTVRYSSHSVGGLSEKDFDCAARVDALIQTK